MNTNTLLAIVLIGIFIERVVGMHPLIVGVLALITGILMLLGR